MSTTVAADDVVVIGSGPAGLAVAAGLVRRGSRVLLVEAGSERERDADRELTDGGPAHGVWEHEPLSENRRRVFGGTSTAWGGRCIPLDPIDFEQREWIPGSGWPIPYAEFERYMPEAAALLEIPDGPFSRPVKDPLLVGDTEIDGSPVELWSPPTNAATMLGSLERTGELRVLRDTHVISLRSEADGVTGLLADRAGERLLITGRRYVLAAGALENARLLLDTAFAETLPALGRYYMSHVFATPVAFSGPPLPAETGFFRESGTYVRHRWQLSADAQRRLRVGNVVGFIARPPAGGTAIHLDPLTALVGAAKLVLRNARTPREIVRARRQLLAYAQVLRKADLAFWRHTLVQGLRRGGRHRLPMLLPPRSSTQHHLTVQAEHLPHPDSRVLLGDDRDRYGVRRLEASIDFERLDFDTVEAFIAEISRFLGDHGYRADRSARAATAALAAGMYRGFNSNAHHIGTTRMGIDPATSVVDSNCRVHGATNLFVAGASVFPTSGHANPTFSLVTLAARLADHLARS